MAYRSQNIKGRLARLEREAVGEGRVLAVEISEDSDISASDVLREAGYEIGPRDLVVHLRRFREQGPCVPRIVSVTTCK
jgi:hypothetical protein